MIQGQISEAARADSALLAGGYTLETPVSQALRDSAPVDARYRDLQQVERRFRNLKTGFLEVRRIFLATANRTRAHGFVAMLALKLTRLFEDRLQAAFASSASNRKPVTLADALTARSRSTYLYYRGNGQQGARLPQPDQFQQAIFAALGITLLRSTAAVL